MRFILVFIFLVSFIVNSQEINQPIAKKTPKSITTNGHTRVDNYFWMNERDSKDVLDYIAQENAASKAYFEKHQNLISTLLGEFEARINPNQVFAPFELNGKIYQEKYVEGLDYPKTYVLDNGKETLFIDENELAKGHSYYGLGQWQPSPNNRYVALCEDVVGRRNYTVKIREFSTSKFLTDEIKDTDGSFIWANDNKTIYYVKKDPVTLRSFQVYKHTIGTKTTNDILVYEDKDEKFNVGITKSNNGKFIYIFTSSSTTSEQWLIDADNASAKPILFLARHTGHIYEVFSHETGFYVLTNHEAKNKRLLFFESMNIRFEEAKEVIPHSETTLLEDITVLRTHLVVEQRSNGLEQIKRLRISDGYATIISVPEETYSLGTYINKNYNADYIYYHYNSLTTPSSIYKIGLESEIGTLFHREELLDPSFSPENYESKRIWVTANDGTKIPVSIVYKKGIDLSKAPCLQYGYGSYGYTIPDVFSATRLSLLDRGFVFALAHIRGGKYLGEEWYESGKLLSKRNTFTDFVNVAEYLGIQGYCDPDRIYAQGGSAGGLLMGAVVNLAPYLFKGVIADVPFVDVVNTMLDETIPLTVGEYEEWGNPNIQEYYYYMLSYSPYDNVRKMDYPNLFINTGYHDSQVQYWEPLKWIAKIRELRTNKNILMLDCNMDAGHGGGSGRSTERLEKAKEFAFILSLEELD